MTLNFTRAELEFSATGTRLGLKNVCPDMLLSNMQLVANQLQKIRDHYGKPVRVLSCYRSPAVNAAVGGSDTSAHRYALAADFRVNGESVLEVCKWCSENIEDYDQIIYEFGESGWTHLGFRLESPRKQLLTAIKRGSRTVYEQGLIA
jgi:hypothetical protein